MKHLTLSNHRDTICGLCFIERDPGVVWTYASDAEIWSACTNCAHVLANAYHDKYASEWASEQIEP